MIVVETHCILWYWSYFQQGNKGECESIDHQCELPKELIVLKRRVLVLNVLRSVLRSSLFNHLHIFAEVQKVLTLLCPLFDRFLPYREIILLLDLLVVSQVHALERIQALEDIDPLKKLCFCYSDINTGWPISFLDQCIERRLSALISIDIMSNVDVLIRYIWNLKCAIQSARSFLR